MFLLNVSGHEKHPGKSVCANINPTDEAGLERNAGGLNGGCLVAPSTPTRKRKRRPQPPRSAEVYFTAEKRVLGFPYEEGSRAAGRRERPSRRPALRRVRPTAAPQGRVAGSAGRRRAEGPAGRRGRAPRGSGGTKRRSAPRLPADGRDGTGRGKPLPGRAGRADFPSSPPRGRTHPPWLSSSSPGSRLACPGTTRLSSSCGAAASGIGRERRTSARPG